MSLKTIRSDEKLNLIYVVSIGHSGSTLLESILGAHSQITTGGEIQIWPHEIRQDTMRCACGKKISACEFWSELQNRVDPLQQAHPQIDFFREEHNAGRTVRLQQLSGFTRNGDSPVDPDVYQYALNNYEVYREFMGLMEDMTGKKAKWIVDSSKDPYRLLWLAKSGLFNIKVFHVVKHPKAFAYSMYKRLPEVHKQKLRLQLYEAARQSFKWTVENYLSSLIAEHYLRRNEYMLVQYETMASEPESFFARVFDFLSLDPEQEALTGFREETMHTVAGNPMRYRSDGIKLDEKWKQALPKESAYVADLMTFLTKSKYGY